jgi:hypothetical protein
MEYHCPNTRRLIHNTDNCTVTVHRLNWLLCHASRESPCASQKKLHCSRAYHFAPPQYTDTSEFTHRELCTNWTVPWQSTNICKLAGKSQSTLRQTAISWCTHTGVCVCAASLCRVGPQPWEVVTHSWFNHTPVLHVWIILLFMMQQLLVGQGLLTVKPSPHSEPQHSAGLLWTNDQPYTETCTWHTTFTRDRHPNP